uniref:VDE lipocalin domain-containing protein n=1 Tax=Populus alba TaxID=43335 RepID=A0A4V5ZXL2_POPAL|nr:hypothetical protein D5086_0000324560 [Populus alba]
MNGFRLELAKCSANPSCAANVACLHTCNKGPDEIECQIKCGDLFENSLVMSVQSHEKSVYLRSLMFGDSVPNPAFLVKNFKVADFIGKWFVTSGLFTRSTVQRFVQDPVYPAMLYNHDNELLHY